MSFISRTWNFFFEKLFAVSLREMNFGKTNNYRVNGELRSLEQLAKRWKDVHVTLFDVGANVGEFTLEIIQAFGKGKFNLYAFEPSSRAWAQLRQRVPDMPNINVQQLALSHEEGTAELYFPEEGSTLASLYQRDLGHTKWNFGKKESVKISTVDKFCEKNKIEYIHLLKMDVEGHELDLLKGAQGMLGKNAIEVIQFEFGGANIDSRTYFKDFYQLLAPKYRIYRILAGGLRELPAYTEKLEIFQSANYLAIRRS
jgi:FkbM family methyltransferase